MPYYPDIAEPIPMKRELKREMPEIRRLHEEAIAEPIPMKRELKPPRMARCDLFDQDCRAYPDEKGIETWRYPQPASAMPWALQSLSR